MSSNVVSIASNAGFHTEDAAKAAASDEKKLIPIYRWMNCIAVIAPKKKIVGTAIP
jgi:hypothetical protein